MLKLPFNRIDIYLLNILIYIFIGYIFGSIPVGYLYSKSKGVNIFEVGSKNPGSTNVGRILGKTAGRLVFVLDIIKTILPITICAFFYYYITKNLINPIVLKYGIFNDKALNNLFDINYVGANIRYIKLIVGLGAILGHNFSIFTHFKGGKGVSSTVAAIACFNIYYAIILFIIFKIICKITNYVSLSSILTLVIMFISSYILTKLSIYPFKHAYSNCLPFIYFIYMSLGIIRHYSNIIKLINGTENKIKC